MSGGYGPWHYPPRRDRVAYVLPWPGSAPGIPHWDAWSLKFFRQKL